MRYSFKKEDSSKGGTRTAAKYGADFTTKRARKGGQATKARYGLLFFSFMHKRRKPVKGSQYALLEFCKKEVKLGLMPRDKLRAKYLQLTGITLNQQVHIPAGFYRYVRSRGYRIGVRGLFVELTKCL